ncbi:MAG: NUDIX domain-containing protein [Bacteroidales bacterium]|nr:NUDIX domain-containing protein [Bacteroidales bacterium]MCF8390247.1 NUDIX domain-containing protein [Bacteroidales bacterium]
MYKVFFNDRIVFFINRLPSEAGDEEAIYYKYKSLHGLRVVLTTFYHQDFIKELYLINDDIQKIWFDFISGFKLIKAAGGLVKNEKSEVLFIKRNGVWDLPKGKVEKKESFEETAIREVKEECGLNKLILKSHLTTTYHTYFLKDKFILKQTEWYEMESSTSESLSPQTKEDITDVLWVEEENLSYLTGNSYGSIIDVLSSANLIEVS